MKDTLKAVLQRVLISLLNRKTLIPLIAMAVIGLLAGALKMSEAELKSLICQPAAEVPAPLLEEK